MIIRSKKKAIWLGLLYEIILDLEDVWGIDKVLLLYLSYFDVRARDFGEEEEGLGIGWWR